MKTPTYITLIAALVVLMSSCGSNPPESSIQDVKPVDIKPIKQSVVIVKEYTNKALVEIALMKREAEEARLEAEEAKLLLKEMKTAKSPFTEPVEALRDSYEESIKSLTDSIEKTDKILIDQRTELKRTDRELEDALTDSIIANERNQLLISSNKTLKKKADDGAKYKTHWDSRWERKIKTILWSVGITLGIIIALIVWQWFSDPTNITKKLARGLLFKK